MPSASPLCSAVAATPWIEEVVRLAIGDETCSEADGMNGIKSKLAVRELDCAIVD